MEQGDRRSVNFSWPRDVSSIEVNFKSCGKFNRHKMKVTTNTDIAHASHPGDIAMKQKAM